MKKGLASLAVFLVAIALLTGRMMSIIVAELPYPPEWHSSATTMAICGKWLEDGNRYCLPSRADV
jgi:hypothetical protein